MILKTCNMMKVCTIFCHELLSRMMILLMFLFISLIHSEANPLLASQDPSPSFLSTTSTSTLPQSSTTSEREDNAFSKGNWVVNSNLLALGFNPIQGDPVCYTGNCRMNGFGGEVFKLNYNKVPIGSCTTKLIPEHVTLTCVQSNDIRAKTERISTYDELNESYRKSSSSGGGIGLGPVSFQYGESEQTTKMLTDIYIYNYTLFYTYVTTSYIKLTSTLPFLELSDIFRATVVNMPCCSNENITNKYIEEMILNKFGYAVMSEIHLGGVAQQLTTIESQEIEKIRSEGYETSEQVGFSFIISFGEQETEKYDKETHTKFMKYVKNIHASTMGGEPFTLVEEQEGNDENSTRVLPSKLSQWLKTVPSNPGVIKFKLQPILSLLTPERFPDPDANIIAKSMAIEKLINRYSNGTQARCFNDCTGPLNGKCVPMKDASIKKDYFNFGTCQCSPDFEGPDCSTPGTMPTAPTPPTTPFRTTIPHGEK